jgi:hypothetical protein
MKAAIAVLGMTLVFLAPIISGCVPGLQATKPSGEDTAAAGPKEPRGAQDPARASKASGKEIEGQLPPPPPDYKPSRAGDIEGPPDLSFNAEINQSALDFAKNIPNVKHAKTCFSKVYGGASGWYLILYIQKGKKITLEQYSWSPGTKEWEFSYGPKEVSADQLEFQLKGEVPGEKCFRLK